MAEAAVATETENPVVKRVNLQSILDARSEGSAKGQAAAPEPSPILEAAVEPEEELSIDNARQRIADTQKVYQQEHQEKLEMEKQIGELREMMQKQNATADKEAAEKRVEEDAAKFAGLKSEVSKILEFDDLDDDNPQEKMTEALNKIVDAFSGRISTLQDSVSSSQQETSMNIADQILKEQERQVRVEHPDYDKVVTDKFFDLIEATPALRKKIQGDAEAVGTAMALINNARQQEDIEKVISDPDSFYKEKAVLDSPEAVPIPRSGTSGITAGMTSQRPPSNSEPGRFQKGSDIAGSLLNARKARNKNRKIR